MSAHSLYGSQWSSRTPCYLLFANGFHNFHKKERQFSVLLNHSKRTHGISIFLNMLKIYERFEFVKIARNVHHKKLLVQPHWFSPTKGCPSLRFAPVEHDLIGILFVSFLLIGRMTGSVQFCFHPYKTFTNSIVTDKSIGIRAVL